METTTPTHEALVQELSALLLQLGSVRLTTNLRDLVRAAIAVQQGVTPPQA